MKLQPQRAFTGSARPSRCQRRRSAGVRAFRSSASVRLTARSSRPARRLCGPLKRLTGAHLRYRECMSTWEICVAERIAPVIVIRECEHERTVPVTLKLTGQLVARICLDCDEDLPVTDW